MSNLLMRKSTVQAGGPSILAAPFPPLSLSSHQGCLDGFALFRPDLLTGVALAPLQESVAASGRNTPPHERMTARSTTFSSSLALPDQGCDCCKSDARRHPGQGLKGHGAWPKRAQRA